MDILTREQAIKRIKDIERGKSCEHLNLLYERAGKMSYSVGAIKELMAIFEISEEEINDAQA